MPDIKLPFGLKGGRMVGTDEVQSGLGCGCTCAECGGLLVAHKGAKVAHHFAHHVAGNCSGGLETALHRAGKQIVLDECRLVMPGLFVVGLAKDRVTGLEARVQRYTAPREVEFNEAHAEQWLKGVRADVLAWHKGKQLVIEIAVTHVSDAEKKTRLADKGIAAVEIDISKISMPTTMAELRRHIIDSPENKTWLFNPKLDGLQASVNAEAVTELEQMLVKARADQERADARREEEHAKKEKEKAKKQSEAARREALVKIRTDQEAEWHRRFKEGDSAKKLELALGRLRIVEAVLPEYLNFPTRGDKAFPVERKVWQAGAFAALIHSDEKYVEISVE